MTPERKEEIKRDAQEESNTIYGNCSANITNIELLELLAALEESQQQAKEWEKNARTEYRIHNEVQDKLVEAQQTIARQREALKYYATVYVAHERLEEWDNGKRARKALEEESKP